MQNPIAYFAIINNKVIFLFSFRLNKSISFNNIIIQDEPVLLRNFLQIKEDEMQFQLAALSALDMIDLQSFYSFFKKFAQK